jgi:hypothetical protein
MHAWQFIKLGLIYAYQTGSRRLIYSTKLRLATLRYLAHDVILIPSSLFYDRLCLLCSFSLSWQQTVFDLPYLANVVRHIYIYLYLKQVSLLIWQKRTVMVLEDQSFVNMLFEGCSRTSRKLFLITDVAILIFFARWCPRFHFPRMCEELTHFLFSANTGSVVIISQYYLRGLLNLLF